MWVWSLCNKFSITVNDKTILQNRLINKTTEKRIFNNFYPMVKCDGTKWEQNLSFAGCIGSMDDEEEELISEWLPFLEPPIPLKLI